MEVANCKCKLLGLNICIESIVDMCSIIAPCISKMSVFSGVTIFHVTHVGKPPQCMLDIELNYQQFIMTLIN